MDPSALLADLDTDQRAAVETASTLVAVIAGAGSGKTRVLTRRIAYRIAVESADPRHTIALTFTRQAAGELRRRLVALGVTDQITAGTFHAVASQLLRQRWADRDEAPRSVVNDRGRIVASLPAFQRGAARGELDGVVDALAYAAARGMSPESYVRAVRSGETRSVREPEFIAEVMAAYADEKRRRRIVDLDDLLALAIAAIERDQSFAESIRWRFRHVLVDEAQDLNPLQHRLVDLIRDGRDDLFLVGDPAQAIYGFNGSDPTLLTDIGDRFAGIEVVRLPVNHRCTPQVVDAGRHVLHHADIDVTVGSNRADGPAVSIRDHDDERAEAAAVAGSIARADPGLVRSSHVAVLARTHAALAPVRTALVDAGVAVRVRATGAGSELGQILGEAYRLRDPDVLRRWIRDQHELANEHQDQHGTGDDDPHRRVALAANEFLRSNPTGDGGALRAWVGATDPFGEAEPGVELLTFHGAKGREWHTVHLVGCETSLVPHRSATTNALRAEEARLFYVAITRATDEVAVHWARRRGGYQRKLTPLLDDYVAVEPEVVAPPSELRERPARDDTLERLHAWRDHAARASGILPSELCSDKVLAIIAERRPSTPDELDDVTGMGAITAGRLYDGIASALGESLARSVTRPHSAAE